MNMAKMQNLIVDDRARGVFRVNRRAFTDPEVLEQERRAVLDLESVRPHGKLSFNAHWRSKACRPARDQGASVHAGSAIALLR